MFKYGLILLAAPLLAQNLSIGVRAGVPITDLVDTLQSPNFGFNSDRPRYVLGPTFEARLPLGLGFHIDALYRKVSFDVFSQNPSGSASFSGGFWQFPVMLKYRMGAGPYRPFVSAGPSFSKLTGVGDTALCAVTLGERRCGEILRDSSTGFALGAGFDAGLPVIRLAPEIRYTRLGSEFFRSTPSGSLTSQRNQLEFLLGITF